MYIELPFLVDELKLFHLLDNIFVVLKLVDCTLGSMSQEMLQEY